MHNAASIEPSHAMLGVPLGRHLGDRSSSLQIEQRTLCLDIRSPGLLVPWIGPAIRGITALRYRAAVCRQPREEWNGRWQHCRGCPHVGSCGYGIAFEPEATASLTSAAATATEASDDIPQPPSIDAVRRVVIAPEFPVKTEARRGDTVNVRITSIGGAVSATVPDILAALATAGQRDGLGPDRVRFALADSRPAASVLVVNPTQLPMLAPAAPLPRLTIRLDSPLFLREREARSRRMILTPDFRAFVRHAVRIVREFFPSATPGPTETVETLATGVEAIASDLRPFHQEKASRRTFRRFEMAGVVGACTFADVPCGFLPWLSLAGILHAGGHRVAGAGGWTVLTERPAAALAADTPR